MSAGPVNLLVFREDRRRVTGPELKAELGRALTSSGHGKNTLSALLLAGEMECGVADAAPELLPEWQSLTDQLARAMVTGESLLIPALHQFAAPPELRVSTAEGFAYYGLHPLAYADVIKELPELSGTVLVVGIRSIGSTLSAVAAAAARGEGRKVLRFTVRPEGHPYFRHTRFSPSQLEQIAYVSAASGSFLVVDEGPGLSGSSFISVAEALVRAGAAREKITLLCGHQPDLDSLQTENGPMRARQFRWCAVSNEARRPAGADIWIGAGEWRKFTRIPEECWPASWTNFERMKYLSSCKEPERQLFKFAGFGHYGERVIRREQAVADAGFGLPSRPESEGFASSPWLCARPMRADDLSAPVLARLAEYCAFRASSFQVAGGNADALQHMAEHNLAEMQIDAPVHLSLERPVIADGRMQPHEWLFTPDGDMFKTDSGAHGDDHFFPGPTDIAWDLAGAVVEWDMSAAECSTFLEMYRRASGDDPTARIADFITAYAVFRSAYCRMAANAMAGSNEEPRLRAAADFYTGLLPGRPTLLRASGM
ncbi:MAG TPA: hypothetical protein VFI72_17780 [Candidatus Angelobacter sp.]|nr:hypothetical protein [Candidatus Angelobacter sp.]